MSNGNYTALRGVFERPAASFALNPKVIGWILADTANPLHQIAHAIPGGAKVLDVGAGNGILPQLLKALGTNVCIDAIEPDPVARDLARTYYRECFAQDLEAYLETDIRQDRRYDFIVMADVLEHLANPEPSLKALQRRLCQGGWILLSTPNIAFASVRLALLNGHFDYSDSGIIEKTHLRFYTHTTLLRLFAASGFLVARELRCLRDPLAMEIALDEFWFSPGLLWKIDRDPLSRVYQFLFYLTMDQIEKSEHIEIGNRGAGLPMQFLMKKTRRLLGQMRSRLHLPGCL